MRVNDLVKLGVKPKRITDPFEYLEDLVRGKLVLNVGAAGGVEDYLPDNRLAWLHHRLDVAAAKLVGVDIDSEGIEYARGHGVEILNANCENMELGTKFDFVILSDVIEHMNAPVYAVQNLMRHLLPDGTLCITTPNAIAALGLGKILTGRSLNIYWDHVATYCPEHIQALCDRLGYRLDEVFFFDHVDRRTRINLVKSYVSAGIAAIYPRLASSFLAFVKHA